MVVERRAGLSGQSRGRVQRGVSGKEHGLSQQARLIDKQQRLGESTGRHRSVSVRAEQQSVLVEAR